MAKQAAAEAAKLTAKQSRFVDEYLVSFDATAAARLSDGEFVEQPPRSGYYVYLLVSPITHRVFYVGKGVRSRALQHGRDAKAGIADNAEKYRAICEIHEQGQEPLILYRAIESEAEAYRYERLLIFGLKDAGITNKLGGRTTPGERIREKARHNLKMMKTRDRWKQELPSDVEARVVRVFGSLDACYDRLLGGFTELSRVPDDFNGAFSPSQILEGTHGST